MKRGNCSTAPKYLDQPQVAKLFQVARTRPLRDRLLVLLLYRFGLRISEALGLRWADVNMDRAELTVYGLKGGLQRTYSIGADLRPLLKRMDRSGTFLFISRESDQWTRTPAWMAVKSMMAEAGLPPKFGPHSLRHSLAVHMLDSGLRLEQVKDQLRHRSIRSTEIYGAVSSSARREYTDHMARSARIVKA